MAELNAQTRRSGDSHGHQSNVRKDTDSDEQTYEWLSNPTTVVAMVTLARSTGTRYYRRVS